MTCIHTFVSGLPLDFDIEGPSENTSDVVFILGARPITGDAYDLNFGGRIATAAVVPSTAPPRFSGCVLSCLESLTVNTSVASASIFDSGFDRVSRVLELIGPASPADFQAVLRTLEYLNSAIDLNIAGFTLEVGDGVNQTSVEIGVRVLEARKRRNTEETLSVRHTFSFHEIDAMEASVDGFETELKINVDAKKRPQPQLSDSTAEHRSYHLTYWPASLVVLTTVFSALLVLVTWGLIRHKRSGNTNMA